MRALQRPPVRLSSRLRERTQAGQARQIVSPDRPRSSAPSIQLGTGIFILNSCLDFSPESFFEVSCEIRGKVGQAVCHKEFPNVAQVIRDLRCMCAVAKIEIKAVLDHNIGLLQARQEVPLYLWVWSRPGASHSQPTTLQSSNYGSKRVFKVSNLI